MAVYTTQVRSIVEQINNDNNFEPSSTDPIVSIEQRIENARPIIFSFSYPILEADKARFEKNFIRHFYTREIGLETYSLWRLKLAAKLNMIIPKYNKYFEEATRYIDKDLLNNIDYTIIRDFEGNKTQNQTEVLDGTRRDNLMETMGGSDTDTTNRDFVRAYSDTPQGNMSNLLDEKYLTNLTHEYDNGSQVTRAKGTTRANTGTVDTDNTTTKTGADHDEQDETTRHVGKNGGITYAEALLKARESYLNIDLMLCDELDDLFMQIW